MSLGDLDQPLAAIQRGLEVLYRIDTHLDVHDFLLTQAQRAHLQPGRHPREQLLLREHEDGLDLSLYIEEEILHTLSRHDPREEVGEHNLGELLLCLEGVSHFIYTVDRAQNQRGVSALELELQAEVDKYVSLVLLCWDQGGGRPRRYPKLGDLISRLFLQVTYDPDLSSEEHDRYTAANDAARRYALGLERRYLARHDLGDFLKDVRAFWRLSCAGKFYHISGIS